MARIGEGGLDELGIEPRVSMSVGLWVIVGIVGFLVLSLAVGLALAAILGRIGQEVSELLESELWVSAPLRRALESEEGEVATEEEAASHADRGARIASRVKARRS